MKQEEFETRLDELCEWSNTYANVPKHNKSIKTGFPVVTEVYNRIGCHYCNAQTEKQPIITLQRKETGWHGKCQLCKKRIKPGEY